VIIGAFQKTKNNRRELPLRWIQNPQFK